MCGICGIVNFSGGKVQKSLVKRMNQSMLHRGPDDEGVYVGGFGDYSVVMGHRRLSIIDLVSGHQPIYNEDKSMVIVFNGEIYNFQELRSDLQKRGHIFNTHSDTEVILHLFEEYGQGCLDFLRGAFAFAIWDNKASRLFVARDRVGKRPLLYTVKNGNLIFASEFKAILESGLVEKEINLEALDAYLTYGYVPAPLTIYKNVYKLLPAHYLILENKKLKTYRYWSLNFKDKLRLDEGELTCELRNLVYEAVKIRMISDVPLGVFLSGGIDSTIVTGLMSRISDKKIKTFSIGFTEERYNELSYARIAAKEFNTEHKEFIVKPHIEDILPLLVQHYGEPYADSSSIPSYYLTKMTRSYVTVALNGDGGDELFAGYERHWANRLAHSKLIRLFLRFGGKVAIEKLIPKAMHPKDFLGRIRRFTQAASDPAAIRYQKWVGFFAEDFKNRLYSQEFKDICANFNSLSYLQDLFNDADGLDPVDSFLYVDNLLNLPNDFLVKMDIVCMMNSLEGRSPFLDHRLMEFAARLPSRMKLRGRSSKYILKKAFRGLLPEKIFRRGKMGFALPIGFWFRDELKDFVKGILFSDSSLKRGYFNQHTVRGMLDDHFKAKRDYTHPIWALLVLELWHQVFID